MKRLHPAIRYPLLILINVTPFILDVLLYRLGVMDNLYWFFRACAGLVLLNYTSIEKPLVYIFVQLLVMLCIWISETTVTELYYCNISDDWATPVVGKLVLFVEEVIFGTATVVTAIIKIVRKRKVIAHE